MKDPDEMEKLGCVYVITNSRNTVLYTGVTSDLKKRIYEHKHHLVRGFTHTYNVDKLVYYEVLGSMEQAILREKQLKGWVRKKKIDLIESKNSKWQDLYATIM